MENWNSWKSMYKIGHSGGRFILICKRTGKVLIKRGDFHEIVRAAKSWHEHELKKIDEVLLPLKGEG